MRKVALKINDLKRIMAEKKVFYDHSADKSEKKWNCFSQTN